MNRTRVEFQVGLFVLLCLVLLAVLLLQFSKGVTLFRNTYTIILNTANVGGLKPRAQVLMSGVVVGNVSKATLSPQGTNVAVYLSMYHDFLVPTNSTFKIEQSGFLGDQYVAIYPAPNQGDVLGDGAQVHAKEPFNIQEVASKLNDVIDAVQHVVLNTNTLTNVAVALVELKDASIKADLAVDRLNGLILSNSAPLTTAFSNLVTFSDQLDALGVQTDDIISTNRPKINAAVSNLYTASVMVTNLLSEVDHGNGLVAELLMDRELALKAKEIAGGLSETTTNLAIATSNLNRLGLWHFLWYHPKETNHPPRTPAEGRNPSNN